MYWVNLMVLTKIEGAICLRLPFTINYKTMGLPCIGTASVSSTQLAAMEFQVCEQNNNVAGQTLTYSRYYTVSNRSGQKLHIQVPSHPVWDILVCCMQELPPLAIFLTANPGTTHTSQISTAMASLDQWCFMAQHQRITMSILDHTL